MITHTKPGVRKLLLPERNPRKSTRIRQQLNQRMTLAWGWGRSQSSTELEEMSSDPRALFKCFSHTCWPSMILFLMLQSGVGWGMHGHRRGVEGRTQQGDFFPLHIKRKTLLGKLRCQTCKTSSLLVSIHCFFKHLRWYSRETDSLYSFISYFFCFAFGLLSVGLIMAT